MDSWIPKAVVIVANIALIAIRAPHGHRSRSVKVVKDHTGILEVVLLSLAWVGFVLPLIWLALPVLDSADYALRTDRLILGLILLAAGLWLFHCSHMDLGTNWSITLQLREHHELITQGVYRMIRHPMYSALLLYSVGQILVLPNWIAGPSYLVSFGILFAFRLRHEERMMIEHFGDDYREYMARTWRLVPGVW